MTLGVANFSASISEIYVYNAIEIAPTNDFIAIHSAIPSAVVEHFLIDDEEFSMMSLEEELLPLDFVKNSYRELTNIGKFLFSTNGKPFKIQTNRSLYQLKLADTEGVENILFLEK